MIDPSAIAPDKLLIGGGVLALSIGLSLWSICHAFFRKFPTEIERLIWLVVVVFVPFLGGLAYLFFGRPRATKRLP